MLALTGKRIKTIDRMKDKDWEVLGLTADTRAVMDQIYEDQSKLNSFITDLLGYTKTQFMANITADTAQLLTSMGMYVAGKPTAANFKKMLEDLLAERKYDRIYLMLGINELGYNFDRTVETYGQAVDTLPEGPINLGNKMPKVPAGQFIARHEAPRGHLVYKVVTNGGQENHRLSLHVPTFKNAPTVPVMLRGNTVADAGLIVASIDPCFSCLDR